MGFDAQNHCHQSLLFPNKTRSLKELLLQGFPNQWFGECEKLLLGFE
jgi:hypothetical protein